MPFMLSNRSTPLLSYTVKEEGPNGWHYEFASSLGTESLVKKHRHKIGSDVVAHTYLSMIMWREYEGGIELYNIVKGEANGWLPMWVQNYYSK